MEPLITSQQRHEAQSRLIKSHARGDLSTAELERRLELIWTATTQSELDAASGSESLAIPQSPSWPLVQDSYDSDARLPVIKQADPDESGESFSISVFSGTDKSGDWVVAPRHVAIACFGGSELDLRQAHFQGKDIEIVCVASFGGIDIIVPPDMNVEVAGLGLFGSFEWEKKHHPPATKSFNPDMPKVRITGLAFFGGVDIHRLDYGVPLTDN